MHPHNEVTFLCVLTTLRQFLLRREMCIRAHLRAVVIGLCVALAGCAVAPVYVPPMKQHDLGNVIWTEVEAGWIGSVCREQQGSGSIYTNGCYKRVGKKCYFWTVIVTEENQRDVFRTVGHELFHCAKGNFHTGSGNRRWVITREAPLP